MGDKARVVIVGAGFGGLFAAKELAGKEVEVVLIDKNNFHTFTPLLYQVATSALDPSEIAYPVRGIFRNEPNVKFLLGTVTDIDTTGKQVTVKNEGNVYEEQYDYLILASGSTPSYFGNEKFQERAIELRTLRDAVDLRNHVLSLFERAVWEQDEKEIEALMTLVVVGGGPTGLETAGAIYELYNHVLDNEYAQGKMKARVILVERQPDLLGEYPDRLKKRAKEQLESLGVEVMVGSPVVDVRKGEIELENGTVIPSHTLVWLAGVKGSPLGKKLGVELAQGDRVRVDGELGVIGVEGVYAVGDMIYLEDENGKAYPQMIPPAQQQAKIAARNVLREISGGELEKFKYKDPGAMATIGRSRAVAFLYNRLQFSGYLAWLVWLVFHLMTLLGFRNRLNVFVNWVWNYFTYDRSVRIILQERDVVG